ncbi:MAG: hypothetical protein ACLP8S_25005 [Solirubrobacteraceae bacterium]
MKSIQSKGVDVRKLILAGAALAVAVALASAGGAAAKAATDTETFSAITTNLEGVVNVIATGDFTAGGNAPIPHGAGKETFQFPNGKFTLVVIKGSKHQNLNLTTCLYTKTASGVYTLTHGTWAYKGISGSGKFSTTLRAVYPLVNGKCPSSDEPGGNGNPEAIQFIETATGPVSLP